jgi:polysaccharide export outer membrane protein
MIPSSNRLVSGAVAMLLVTSPVVSYAQGRGGQTPPRSAATLAPGAAAGGSASATVPEYRIGLEDVLDIVVVQHENLSVRNLQVRPDGRISVPLVNDVQAAGLTPSELRAAITAGLAPQWKADVAVIVREVHSAKISVIGQVKTAGRFELKGQLTVMDALALAGGLLLDYAEADKIYVQRADGTRAPFNYKKFLSNSKDQPNFLLKAGDIVVVP